LVIDRLAGCTLFTKFDVRWGYNNIRIKPGDEWKAAFLTPEGLFEPTVMFFSLTNSPATFQMMMNTIFRPDVAKGDTSVFMDDIAIHTKKYLNETHEQHLARHWKRVHEILDKLEANDLYLKPKKCAFKQEEIEYCYVLEVPNFIFTCLLILSHHVTCSHPFFHHMTSSPDRLPTFLHVITFGCARDSH